MVNNFIGSLGQNLDQDDSRRFGQFGNQVGNLFSKWNGSNSTPWSAIGSTAKSGYNMVYRKDDKDYSDLEESIIYPLQGASAGSQFGGWGALGGALYGLGYSFKDDIGMKDSNFLTQLVFPINMGDGGGLEVNGKSIFNI